MGAASASVIGSDAEQSSTVPPAASVRHVPALHAVTSDEIVLRHDFVERARRVMHAGGARVAVHLRAPRLSGARVHALAETLVVLQQETGAWLVVNDRLDVAQSSGARGIQLTSRSIPPSDATRIAHGLAVGASVHSAEDARRAADAGVDWLVAGHVYDTDSHPDEEPRGVGFIRTLAAAHAIPIIAIGGVRPQHLPTLRAAGAAGVAVIRGVWNASDAGAAVIDYLSAHGAQGGG